MKTAIIYASTHHGNTKKLVQYIAKNSENVDLYDAVTDKNIDFTDYDVVGFASGIYAENYHKGVLNVAKKMPDGKKVFFIYTSAMKKKDYTGSIKKALEGKNYTDLGMFHCVGYNTFGPFRLIGGTGKGHPDKTDLQAALDFYNGICQ